MHALMLMLMLVLMLMLMLMLMLLQCRACHASLPGQQLTFRQAQYVSRIATSPCQCQATACQGKASTAALRLTAQPNTANETLMAYEYRPISA